MERLEQEWRGELTTPPQKGIAISQLKVGGRGRTKQS